jgi:hypothetical protein
MKKNFLPLLVIFFLFGCSKSNEEIINMNEVAGPYIGDSMLYGPGSCTK